jgi:hypothetical protein
MAIELKLSAFKDKYSLPECAMEELKTIFDSFIVDFTHKIMTDTKKTMPKLDTSKIIYAEKKFATKIAEEYASECGVTLEEIPSETGKVTKKDVDKYIKNGSESKSKSKSKSNSKILEKTIDDEIDTNYKISESKTDTESKSKSKSESKSETKKAKIEYKKDFESASESDNEIKSSRKKDKGSTTTKEKCNGITKDGNPCNLNATKTPDGSKKCYCFRHAIDWKQYEVSSDSDNDDNEDDDEDPLGKLIHKDLAIVTEE